jgi:hypothetical protein
VAKKQSTVKTVKTAVGKGATTAGKAVKKAAKTVAKAADKNVVKPVKKATGMK